MPEIVVHHLEKSRSHRVLWLLEELGADYTLTVHQRTRGRRAPEALKRLHPLGRSPVVIIDGRTFVESGAVFEALLDRLDDGSLRPAPGTDAHEDFRFWLHHAEGSLMPPLLLKLLTGILRRGVPFPANLPLLPGAIAIDKAYADGEVANELSFVDGHLADRPWFLGEAFSAADVMMGWPLVAALGERSRRKQYPHVADFVERIQARPAYRAAVDKGGKPS